MRPGVALFVTSLLWLLPLVPGFTTPTHVRVPGVPMCTASKCRLRIGYQMVGRPESSVTVSGCSQARFPLTSLASTRKPADKWPLDLPGADAIFRTIDRPQVELFNAACVLASLLLFGLQTLQLSPDTESVLETFERVIGLGFAFEYLVRWYSRNLDPRHVVQPLVLIDLLSFLPTLLHIVLPVVAGAFLSIGLSNDPTLVVFYGQAWRVLNFEGSGLGTWVGADFVFLRFVRLIRLQRFLRDKDSFANLQLELGIAPKKIKPWQLQLARATSSILSLLFISSGCLYEAEPQISDYFEALYYGVCTLTTVGGITPETAEGRIVVTVSILAGIAIIPLQLSQLAEAYFQREQELLPEDLEAAGQVVEEAGSEERGLLEGRVFQGEQRVDLGTPFGKGAAGSAAQKAELLPVDCGACGAGGHRRDAVFCYRCAGRLISLGAADEGPIP